MSEPKYVVIFQWRQHQSPKKPADGWDQVKLATREEIRELRAKPWVVIQSIHELGPAVTNGDVLF